jgi:hypothetical protein
MPIQINFTNRTIINWGDSSSVSGTAFGISQGSGNIQISNTDDFTGTVVDQTITNWSSDTYVQFTATQGSLGSDNFFYVRIINDSGETSNVIKVSQGYLPYNLFLDAVDIDSTNGTGALADHRWRFNNNGYADTGSAGTSPFTSTVINGGGSFVTTPLCRNTTHSWRCQSSRRECSNSTFMNTGVSTVRSIGGWIQLQTIQDDFVCLYEQGGTDGNIAVFVGMGNTLVAQLADANDDFVQVFSDVTLTVGRTYHILLSFSYDSNPAVFDLRIDGVTQQVSTGTLLNATNFDDHSGDISIGGPGGSLLVGDTDVTFNSTDDCLYAEWASWSRLLENTTKQQLFQRGAIPTVIIASDTQANMQTALDLLSGTVRSDAPLAIQIEDVSGSGDLYLDADNIQFSDRCSISIEWQGTGTLYWSNLNGSNLQTTSGLFQPNSGLINIIDVPVLTLTNIENSSEVRIYQSGTITELARQENVTTGTFTSSVKTTGSNDVDIVVSALGYKHIRLTNVDMSSSLALQIQQKRDRFYDNPI